MFFVDDLVRVSCLWRARPLLLAALLLPLAMLSGCATQFALMPVPATFSTGEIDPFRHLATPDQQTALSLFYATNRGVVAEVPNPTLTVVPGESLRLGTARVAIGDASQGWDALHRLSTSADPGRRPIVELQTLEQLAVLAPQQAAGSSTAAQAFFAQINQAIAASPTTSLIVHVHGGDNTVQRATAQAAQLRHFSGRRTVVLSFMWPSAGTILGYFADGRAAVASAPQFARLMELLAENTRASQIDVLAYDAGVQVVNPGLALLAAPRAGESIDAQRQRLRLGQVYLAAPGVDPVALVEGLGAYADLARGVSLAVGRSPSAAWLEAGGRLNVDLIKFEPVVTERGFVSWYDSPLLGSDMLATFMLNTGPQKRGLEPLAAAGAPRAWSFGADHRDRLIKAMRAQGLAAAPGL